MYKKNIFILLLISIYVMSVDLVFSYSVNHVLATGLSIFVLILLITLNRYIFLIIYFISLILNTILLHIYIHWGSIKGISSRIEVAILSPISETKEYLESIVNLEDLFVIIYFIFGIILLYKYKKTIVNFKLSFKLRLFYIILIILIFGILYKLNIYNKIMPYKIIFEYYNSKAYISKIIQRSNYLKNHQLITTNKFKSKYDHIIIIIGESAQKHHLAIYNYDKNTTPFLSSLKNLKILNALAPTNQTRYSIPCDLSNATPINIDTFYKSPSIITYLNNIGYETYWISNQFKTGKYDSYIASIANEANYVKINNLDYGVSDNVPYDNILINIIKRKIRGDKKQAFFIHLMGSHTHYKERYPSTMAIFGNDSTIHQYDNTIYYTDYILKKLFKIVNENSKKFLFIYFSDHGEVVSDNKFSHGFSPAYKDEFQIPFVIYSSIESNIISQFYKEYKNNNIFNMADFNLFFINAIIDKHMFSYKYNQINKYKVLEVNIGNIKNYNDLETYK